jgi:competence protein ComEC
MLPIAPYPFLRLALFFTSGIAAFVHFRLCVDFLEWILLALSAIWVFVFLIRIRQKEIVLGVCAFLICFFGGALVCKLNTEILDPAHFSHFNDSSKAYLAVVDDELIEKPKSFSTQLQVKSVFQNGKWIAAKGKVLAYFSVNNASSSLKYGDWLVVKGIPSATEPPKNPGQFDYSRFLTFKNIYHQQYIKEDQIAWLKNEPESKIWELAFRARHSLSTELQSVMGKGQEFVVASMLILGIRQSLDIDLFNAYSGAGAIHVLAVSGMHVGLVFALIQLLLGRMIRNRISVHIFYSISLLAIWSFGLITAFSPSVLRAVVMFSVIIIAKWSGRKGNLFNTLGFTAFVILFVSPYSLMSVGFQMSFMAVLGIAYFQPRLLKLWKPQNWIAKSVWEITCISVAAQITTAPLALLYFKQFPTYFLLSNLWVIPASTIILYVGIVFFVSSFWVAIKVALGFLLKLFVSWLNKSMFFVLLLPKSVYRTAYFDDWEIAVLYLVLLSLVLLFKLKNKRYLIGAILLSVTFSCARILKAKKINERNSVIIYSTGKEFCFAMIEGKSAVLYASKDFLENKSALEFNVMNPLKSAGVFDIQVKNIPSSNFILQRSKAKFLVLQQKNNGIKRELNVLKVDYLLLSSSCTNLVDLTSTHSYKSVILQSVKDRKQAALLTNVWSLQTDGAIEFHLSPDGKYYTRSER